MPSICPGGGDDSPFLGCFPNSLFCNLVSDCPGGIDEMNCSGNCKTLNIACILLFMPFKDSLFLKFGEGAGDGKFHLGDDEIAFHFHLSIPLVYFQMKWTELFVSCSFQSILT